MLEALLQGNRTARYAGGCGGWALFAGGVGGFTEGDALCATLYAGGVGGFTEGDALCATLYAGGVGGFAEGDAMCATLYAGGCGGSALTAGGVGGAGGDAPCALYAGGRGECVLFARGDALCAALHTGGRGGCALFAGGVLHVPEMLVVPKANRCVLMCILDVVEGRLCSMEVLQVLELMRCVLLCGGAGGDAPDATLLAGGARSAGGDAMRTYLFRAATRHLVHIHHLRRLHQASPAPQIHIGIRSVSEIIPHPTLDARQGQARHLRRDSIQLHANSSVAGGLSDGVIRYAPNYQCDIGNQGCNCDTER